MLNYLKSPIGIGIIVILIFGCFFLPIQKTQYLIIGINGEGSSAKVGYSYVEEIYKPIINIFAKPNPQNGFTLNVEIRDKNENSLISGTLYNLGSGESSFKIEKEILDRNLKIITDLSFNNEKIDQQIFEGEIK